MSHTPTTKLRCEALNITQPRTGRCTTNGALAGGRILCWVHRLRWHEGKPLEFADHQGQRLRLLFPGQKITGLLP